MFMQIDGRYFVKVSGCDVSGAMLRDLTFEGAKSQLTFLSNLTPFFMSE